MKRYRCIVSLVVVSALFWMGSSQAAIIHESAELGTTGEYGGFILNSDQFGASRFSLTETVQVTAIGGHMWGGSDIFGAIVALPSPTGFPSFLPSAIGTNALASTTFTPGSPSSDVRVPLSVLLSPGDYALVFGSGHFGVTGTALMPTNNTPILGSSYYFSYNQNSGDNWGTPNIDDTRFVVEGNAVPIPGAVWLLGSGLLGLIALKRKRSNKP